MAGAWSSSLEGQGQGAYEMSAKPGTGPAYFDGGRYPPGIPLDFKTIKERV